MKCILKNYQLLASHICFIEQDLLSKNFSYFQEGILEKKCDNFHYNLIYKWEYYFL